VIAELAEALGPLERDPPRALVIAGSDRRGAVFGLDLLDVFDLDRAALERLSRDLVEVNLRLFRFPAPVVAAVNGHAIAGGAILALTADRRIQARGDLLFGLNEVQVGLPLPGPLFEVVRAAVGAPQAAEALLEGRNYRGEEALRVGFAHELVERAELEARALDAARRMGRLPRRAFRRMKEMLHAGVEEAIHRSRAADPFADIWFDPETRAAMAAAREKLLSKKGKP